MSLLLARRTSSLKRVGGCWSRNTPGQSSTHLPSRSLAPISLLRSLLRALRRRAPCLCLGFGPCQSGQGWTTRHHLNFRLSRIAASRAGSSVTSQEILGCFLLDARRARPSPRRRPADPAARRLDGDHDQDSKKSYDISDDILLA